jgi:hypothetical protein
MKLTTQNPHLSPSSIQKLQGMNRKQRRALEKEVNAKAKVVKREAAEKKFDNPVVATINNKVMIIEKPKKKWWHRFLFWKS